MYLVGSLVLVSLSGCGHGYFQEREPWRAEAEIACLKSGAVKESAEVVRIDPISGPGMCGADFPLKVSALDDAMSSYGFADEDLRPPAAIANQPRWPVNQPSPSYPPSGYPQPQVPAQPPATPRNSYPPQTYSNASPGGYAAPSSAPLSLNAPGVRPGEEDIDLPPEGAPAAGYPAQGYPQQTYQHPYQQQAYPQQQQPYSSPPLGPARGDPVAAVGPVTVKPAATLACPIVSALDRWIAESVQPAAMRWFGNRVVEIKQISAYSCRGMNGNPGAHISEHAFGNALDIAAFTLADGRRITVEQGWHGLPEEQGFLRDVQGAACRTFTTVLAPGSNKYHYNHIHVDLMRRARRPVICEPAAVSGEEIAARAQRGSSYGAREPDFTSSIPSRKSAQARRSKRDEEDDEDE